MVCGVCGGLRHVVERGELWSLAINRNQDLLGKSMLALNRHCERVSELTTEEWADLHPCIVRVTAALDGLFAPDLYNFAFLMNFDAHVHLHIIPRYGSPREWRGETYSDPHYGSLFGTEERLATEELLDVLVGAMKGRL
jgi:diadenosine tetraphosphate (Ap4A) HIT family hydrolase